MKGIVLAGGTIALGSYGCSGRVTIGLQLEHATPPSPDALAQAFLIGADFLDGQDASLVLGDNLSYCGGFSNLVATAPHQRDQRREPLRQFTVQASVKRQ